MYGSDSGDDRGVVGMSFPRYERYKDSGVEWLGEVPEHWSLLRIRHLLLDGAEGIKIGPFGSQLTSDMLDDSGSFKVYGQENVIARDFSRGSRRISKEKFDDLQVYEITPGDILVTMMGTSGRCDVVPENIAQGVMDSHLLRMRLKNICSAVFLRVLIDEANYVSHQIRILGKGSIMHGLNSGIVKELLVSIPSVQEQLWILDFICSETSKIDTLISEQQKLIELLKEKRQAVISHAVTKGLNPQVKMKDSGVEWLGEVPEHWDVSRLKFVADVQTGIAKGKDNSGKSTISVPYLRVANVQDGYLDLYNVAEIDIPVDDLNRYCLQRGDVLMNEGGDFDKLGRGHIWNAEIEPCIHQNHVFAVRPTGVSSEWLNTITGSNYGQFYFMTRSKQSTNLASISSSNIMELPVLLPPSDEQIEILELIAIQKMTFGNLISEAQKAITLLQERRSALISAAVTGKIDVRKLS